VVEGSGLHNDDEESDTEAVSDTYFGDIVVNVDNAEVQGQEKYFGNPTINVEVSSDPFNIYGLLNNYKKDNGTAGSNTTPPFSPGFTPKVRQQGLGSKAKKDWIKELNIKLKALGSSGGILCVWDSNVFLKEKHIIFDNFVALYGTWIPNKMKILLISVYAPQSLSVKRLLWNYLSSLITRWNGECLVMGDFDEVRRMEERWGSVFNACGVDVFNSFISGSGLTKCQLEGYSFTWAHPSAKKMSKLDRFLMTNGLLASFPHISSITLDRHLLDHRPILLREVIVDYGATPFRFYHSWLGLLGFDQMVMFTWNSIFLDDSNKMIRFKKKLQILKKEIRAWIA
nr:RNA-directed DNA polymerase, eukaryota [Tanacetum cinerariifolium]